MKVSQFILPLAPALVGAWKLAERDGGGHGGHGGGGGDVGGYINYTTVTGFFMQDDPDTDPNAFDYATNNFGLLDVSYPTDDKFDPKGRKTQWQRFEYYIESLNKACRRGRCHGDSNVEYKVLYMGRHGEGWHNAAESYYGTPAWNCYWSILEGNGTALWSDPLLTPAGEDQTVKAASFFTTKFLEGLPTPETYYSSPMSRCTITANLTFSSLPLPRSRPFRPIIKEFLREGMSVHTCDRRSSRTYIESLFTPNLFTFEAGFTEEDELWSGVLSESRSSQEARSKVVLDDIFGSDDGTWLSITSHSGEIRTLLKVLGHREFRLSTGQIIPVLVKAEFIPEDAPAATVAPWEADNTCDAPPVTSIAGEGCVCWSTATASAPTTTTTSDAVIGDR